MSGTDRYYTSGVTTEDGRPFASDPAPTRHSFTIQLKTQANIRTIRTSAAVAVKTPGSSK